jgi:hypothetical protein
MDSAESHDCETALQEDSMDHGSGIHTAMECPPNCMQQESHPWGISQSLPLGMACNFRILALFETVFFALVEEIRLRATKIHNFRATVAVFF